jgi:hypothetical protein
MRKSIYRQFLIELLKERLTLLNSLAKRRVRQLGVDRKNGKIECRYIGRDA